MKKPKLAVLPYRHHPKYKFVLDLRAFGKGRKFFKTRAEADAECLRQRTLLELTAVKRSVCERGNVGNHQRPKQTRQIRQDDPRSG